MRTFGLSTVLGLILCVCGTACSFARSSSDNFYSESRKVTSFNRIDMSAVGEVYFTQGKECSLLIEGDAEMVKDHQSKVENGTLVVSIEEENKSRDKGVTIYVTAPDLKNLIFRGVGQVICEQPLNLKELNMEFTGVGKLDIKELKCDTLKATVEGVGRCYINVDCAVLNASVNGIGSMEFEGYAGKAIIEGNGLGHVDTNDLKIGK